MEEFVYFFEAVGCGLVKIGYTENPGRRFQQISTCCPFPLTALLVMHGHRGVETLMHKVFHGRRKNGEWFELTADARNLLLVFGMIQGREREQYAGIVWAEEWATEERQLSDLREIDFSQFFGSMFQDNGKEHADAQ